MNVCVVTGGYVTDFFGFLELIGVSLTLHQKDQPHFHFWAFYEGLKMPKILKKNQQNRLKWVKKLNLRKNARSLVILVPNYST